MKKRAMNTYVVLLRGLTPRGRNKVLMPPLRAALIEAGLGNVQTYIQSGNVIAQSNLSRAKLERLVHDVIEKKFGGDITVIARTAAQFKNAAHHNPFVHGDRSRLYFTFLARLPEADLIETFPAVDFSPDQVRIVDDTVYTLYATKYSDSKFNNNYYERKLKTPATTRNFNTVTRLIELSSK